MRTLLLLACLLCTSPALAAGQAENLEAGFDPAVMTEGFLAAHPDLRWRGEGLHAYGQANYELAMTRLKRAARYADKPSQAMIAEMYWNGIGVPQDRALGYVWMDIAAERHYHDFLVRREIYWDALSEHERAAAVERGQAVLAEYGDDVAKPRLERVLRRERRRMTGSRTGFTGFLTIVPNTGPMSDMGMTLRGDQYYAKKYWEPEYYWAMQDILWKAPLEGRVDIGDVEKLDEPLDP
ncbi:SEL1-like repeat protein [Marilutibacter alkalisoli]|uniref:Sel1 repeat family protein n=1 Tax=Marilutibacter alkalisoli TaxID=2591633 RepID=A0A514BVX9_9GAMM|nr:sel1 repeat family protein [Lysobacter alkalisoli]QDH71536.1 sel1 repeat family protein [Lysobacter alkalisoli]